MLARALLFLIRLYQRAFSRWLGLFGAVCRFEPSCSRYAAACIEEHGALKGSLLSIVRLCKCHPFHPGGYDPPPAALTRGTGPAAPEGVPARRLPPRDLTAG